MSLNQSQKQADLSNLKFSYIVSINKLSSINLFEFGMKLNEFQKNVETCLFM